MKQRLLWILVPTLATAALTATLSYCLLPTQYRSDALVLVVPEASAQSAAAATHIEPRLQRIAHQILTRTRLERIVNDFNLYPERRKTDAMEGIAARLRSSIGVQIVEDDAFRVSFVANDARTALRVTERLVSLLIEENLRDSQAAAAGMNQFLDLQIRDVRRQIVEKEAELRRLLAAASGEQFKIIDPARLPDAPVGPQA